MGKCNEASTEDVQHEKKRQVSCVPVGFLVGGTEKKRKRSEKL